MLKFLRKYNTLILVIGGALLMVAFLMPQAIQELGKNQAGREFMRIDGRKITYADADRAASFMFVINNTFPMLLELNGIEKDRAEHWLLLTYEAREQGLVGGLQDGRDFFTELVNSVVEQQAWQLPPDQRQQLRELMLDQMETIKARMGGQARLRAGEVDLAFAELRGIIRLREIHYGSAMRVSGHRAIQEAQRRHEAAVVDYVFLPPDLAADEVADPDDQTLAAHVERFSDVRPGEGEYGIGYLLPPRIKLEWLTLDRAQIEQAVRPDRIEVMQRFLRENPGKDAGPEFDEARPQLEEQIRRDTVDRIVSDAEKLVRAEFAKATRRLDAAGDFRVLPPDWNQIRPDLHAVRDAVVQRLRETHGRGIPAPVVDVRTGSWLTGEELRTLPGIGTSFVQRGNQRIAFADAALSVKELAGTNDLGLQVGVPGVVSRDFQGNQYYFTILDARPESPPDSIDEVRSRVRREYVRLQAFERLRQRTDQYLQQALSQGLRDLATAKPVTPGGPLAGVTGILRENVEVTRQAVTDRSGFERSHIDTDEVRDAILDAAQALDPTSEVSNVPASERTLIAAVPSRLGLAAVQIKAVRPLTVERYRSADTSVITELRRQAVQNSENPFSLERLAERHNAKLPPRQAGTGDES